MTENKLKISLIALLVIGMTALPGYLVPAGIVTVRVFAQTDDAAKMESPVEKVRPDNAVKDEGDGSLSGNDDSAVNKGDAGKNTARVPAAVKPGKVPQAVAENPPAADGLLDITEGAFKYKRIPGIKMSEVAPDITVELPAGKDKSKETDSTGEAGDGTGLFGLSQKTTDLLAKLVLFGVVLLIFILYRFRTRGRRSGVLKRFPKA